MNTVEVGNSYTGEEIIDMVKEKEAIKMIELENYQDSIQNKVLEP